MLKMCVRELTIWRNSLGTLFLQGLHLCGKTKQRLQRVESAGLFGLRPVRIGRLFDLRSVRSSSLFQLHPAGTTPAQFLPPARHSPACTCGDRQQVLALHRRLTPSLCLFLRRSQMFLLHGPGRTLLLSHCHLSGWASSLRVSWSVPVRGCITDPCGPLVQFTNALKTHEIIAPSVQRSVETHDIRVRYRRLEHIEESIFKLIHREMDHWQ
mmetsp:Transcript_36137/g.95971  ORF Transcript_36137/g.95971 Transcript_36137/m.95971 type:complete len:211 (-) Transcript_36137:634-1266(-)